MIIHQNPPKSAFSMLSFHETFAVVHIRITSARYNNHYITSPRQLYSVLDMKHLLWCTLELPRRDIIIIISLHRDNCTLYRISTCGGSRKSHLGTTLIWSQHMTRTFSCGDYSNKMSSCVITENCCLQWKKKKKKNLLLLPNKYIYHPHDLSFFIFFFFFFFLLVETLSPDSWKGFLQQTVQGSFYPANLQEPIWNVLYTPGKRWTPFLWSPSFLAHLSRRLKVSHCDHSLSVVVVVVVRMSVRPQYLNNIS